MKTKIYAIRTANGSWYETHGKWNGSGCFRTVMSKFPPTYYATKQEASAAIDKIVRDFPNEGVYCSIISITLTMREVFADVNERTSRKGEEVAA